MPWRESQRGFLGRSDGCAGVTGGDRGRRKAQPLASHGQPVVHGVQTQAAAHRPDSWAPTPHAQARLRKRGSCLRAVLTDEATRQDLRRQHSQRRLFNAVSLRGKHHLSIAAPGSPLHILWVRRHSACPLRGACMVSAHPGTSSPARCPGPPALAGETSRAPRGVPRWEEQVDRRAHSPREGTHARSSLRTRRPAGAPRARLPAAARS